MDWNTYQSTYGRRYPFEQNGYPYPSHQQQWQPYQQPWNYFDQGNASLDFNCNQPYLCNPSPMFHEVQAGNYISEPCNPYFSSDFSQTPQHDEEADLKNMLCKYLERSDETFKDHEEMSHDQPYSFPYYYDESSNMFIEKHAGDYINEQSHPNFSWDFNQTPPQDEDSELTDFDATLNSLQDLLKESEERNDSIQRLGEQINMLVRVVEETIISLSTPCENKEESQPEEESCELEGEVESQQEEESWELEGAVESQQEEELWELEGEIESMAEAKEKGKDDVAIEQSEEFPIEKPLDTRVEDKTVIGYSNFDLDEFIIPPYIPSQHLELKILLGQVKGEERWRIQLQIYFLEATKRKERILSSTPTFFMLSMNNCKGIKFFMHGWHNFPFDPGGVEQWSG